MAPDTVKLINEPCPCGLDFVWDYWRDLSLTRTTGMAAPDPITYVEMRAWSSLRPEIYLNSSIIRLIIRIDAVFRRAWSERANSAREGDND